uniref:Integrase catalytic domain-containing protein n=1 Tax=Tanacetum cinerariifolium TaxID=118510 RepID=A0A6L2KZH9_TANCI|nr:hypothetical protein [Tanacetum cinerariifolium]
MQKKKNDVKARTTLLLSLPDEHQLRFSKYKTARELWAAILKTFSGNEATKKMKKNLFKQQYGNFRAKGSKTLEQTFNRLQVIIVWRNKSDLDTMSLDDLYIHLKVYESEVQKKTEPNSQNIAFISSIKHISGNEDGNTACVPTASTNVPTASASVATISQDIACAYIASQSSGSQIKFEDINQIDEDDIEEMDIKWNMALLRMRVDKAPRSQDRGRRDNFRQRSKAEEQAPKALMAIDGVGWDWSYMANDGEDHALVADKEAPTEFALMANTNTESKKLETLKQEKEGVDGKLAGLLIDSKDLNNLIESQRPSPTVESTSEEDQNRNPSVYENVASPITPKPFIKFVKPKDSQSKMRSPYRASWVPTVNKNYPPVNRKFSTGSRNFPTANRKFPTASRKFTTGSIKSPTTDMGMKGKAVKPSAWCKITRKRTIKIGKLEFENVYLVKDLKYNLFRVSQICDNKNSVLFTDSECIVLGRDFKLLDDANVLLRTPRRLGHLYFKIMNKLVRHNLVRGLPTKCFENDHTCTACLKGKQHKASLTDDFSRFTWTFFLKSKDETSGILKKFITKIKNLKDLKVKIIRCDNEGEFRNKEMSDFCLQKGIKREFRNAMTPQQNGVAERRNRTLIEAARTMLADAKLPVTFWAEAVNTTCYVQNRVLVNKSHNKTPYELFNGRSPTIGFLKPFGCHVMIFNTLENLGKFEEKGDEENMATEKGSGPNWLFDIDSITKSMNYVPVDAGTISTNLLGTKDATSQEVKKDVSSLRYIALPNWAHDALLEFSSRKPQDHYSTEVPEDSRNLNPTAFTSTPLAGQMKTNSGNSYSYYESNGVEADISNMKTAITASPTPTLRIHKDHPKSQIIVEPKKFSDALQDPSWVEAMQEELFQFKIQKVWTLVDYPKGVRPIGTKWVLKNKKDERGIVIINKARLVVQGHTQEERIDYDEVFAHVARIEAIKLFLAYASFMGFIVYQIDVKSAFLYGTINEDVYVMQPPGFQDPEYPARIYKVEKAMYGLHQAPRAWYGTLSKYLLTNGFQRGTIDQTLFIRRQIGDFILVQIYMDDIIFGSSNPQLCREFEALMQEKFQMSVMGELNFFLSLQVL